MAISAGNYIIRSALDESIVLLTSGGSKSKGAVVTAGALTEADNRCYWKCAIQSSTYNKFYNLNAGTKSGYIMAKSVADSNGITQGAFKAATGTWSAVLSGNTMTVNGQSVSTYFLKAYSDNTLYLTVPDNGGNLYLTTVLDDTTQQEFYFEATTYVKKKLATPSNLTIGGANHIIYASSSANSIYPQWNSSSTNTIYEMRSRTRMYDEYGDSADWGDWSNWAMVQAAKLSAGVMKSATSVSAPGVDNATYSQADIQIETRLTSAKNSGAYNKTGSVTHGASVSGLIQKWKVPTLTISAAECQQYGLSITYSSDYMVAGNILRFVSVMNGATELIANYALTNQDYQGEVLIPWDNISEIPDENDTLDFTVQITEANGFVSATATASVTVTYDSNVGMSFTPTYTETNRLTYEGKVSAYDEVECYMLGSDLRGEDVWIPAEEIESNDINYRIFDIVPKFGVAPTVMWVCSHETGGVKQWGYKKETLGQSISSDYCVWNWTEDKIPHCYILKHRAEKLIQPVDKIELPAAKFVTTGRDYPVYRYSKTISRSLDVEGAIVHPEADTFCLKSDAEKLATANHTIYRQPDGKWYQTALLNISFEREMSYDTVSIEQEAESR